MNRGIWLAAALVIASGANAADTKTTTDGTTATKPTSKSTSKTSTATTKTDGKKTDGQPSSSKKKSSKPSVDPAKVSAVIRAKRVYMYAVESCERPASCDTVLRDGAEDSFMQACLACASQDRCDGEKAAILNGSARGSTVPCEPQP